MSSPFAPKFVASDHFLIPRDLEITSATLSLLEAFYKTKTGKIEETVFAFRFETKFISDDQLVAYCNIVDRLANQCQEITAKNKNPEETTKCLQFIEICEEMHRIAGQSPSRSTHMVY